MTSPVIPGFDGLMTLSQREGVDIRPTLLRVLTDLYVQASSHTDDEERQFVELASRLIGQVDDATRAVVRARLSIYPHTPTDILARLNLEPARSGQQVSHATRIEPARAHTAPMRNPTDVHPRTDSGLLMQQDDAAAINQMFFAADAAKRSQILVDLDHGTFKQSARIPASRAARAVETLEMAAFVGDIDNFIHELGETLMLPARIAARVADDPGGEPLACAAKALGMPSYVFQRVLLFLNPSIGSSVNSVYRLSRLYDVLSERPALVMLAVWQGASLTATGAKYRSALYDDERHRGRQPTIQTKVSAHPPVAATTRRGHNPS